MESLCKALTVANRLNNVDSVSCSGDADKQFSETP
jgi:hypothetical protein